MGLRAELAAHLATELGDGIFVFPSGKDVMAVPAVVLNPSDPYMAPTTMQPQGRISVALDIHVVTNRTEPDTALDAIEDLRFAVTNALRTFVPASRWTAFGRFGQTEIAGTVYAMAVLEVLFADNDRGAS